MAWTCFKKGRQWLGDEMHGVWSGGYNLKKNKLNWRCNARASIAVLAGQSCCFCVFTKFHALVCNHCPFIAWAVTRTRWFWDALLIRRGWKLAGADVPGAETPHQSASRRARSHRTNWTELTDPVNYWPAHGPTSWHVDIFVLISYRHGKRNCTVRELWFVRCERSYWFAYVQNSSSV